MFKFNKPNIKVFLPLSAIEVISDECDGFDSDETGGRLVGHYRKKGKKYEIEVTGVIGAGPKAKRTPTSFFQDGEYQEKIFRNLEEQYPDIEHLGNWHTHHVNGLSTLSSGDRNTYQRTVNHHLHNTDFFYAMLVVQKTSGNPRYKIKHFFFQKNDPTAYEIPDENIQITDNRIIWPLSVKEVPKNDKKMKMPSANPIRAKDQDFFEEFYPQFKPLFSKSVEAFYWKGQLELIDGTSANLVLMESEEESQVFYSPAVSGHELSIDFSGRKYKSAREAILKIEKEMNKNIFSRSLK